MRFHLYLTILISRVNQYMGQGTPDDNSQYCGQVFVQSQSSSGTFTSPNYPSNYGNLMTCTWSFRPEPGYSINIKFSDFNLEGSFTCSFDSVRVENKRYCGTTLPDDIISTTDINVIFKTDVSVTRRGFSATYRYTVGTADCGHPGIPLHGNKTGDTYTYQSVVTFGCQEGYDLIGARSITCQSNGVWSADRPACRERVINCGDPGTPVNGQKTGIIFTVFSVVTFSCNEGYDVQGSSRITCDPNGLWSDFTPRCVPTCGLVISQSDMVSGTFTSPNYPSNYGNNRGCTWVPRPWQGYSLYIEFTDFSLESHPTCNYDYLLVGSDKYCGDTLPDPVTLPAGVNMILHSDYSVSRRGFAATFRFIPSPPDTSGQTPVPNPPDPGPQTTCPNIVDLPNGQIFGSNYVGSDLQFQCNSGYQLQGSSVITCMSSGRWSESLPYCQRVVCADVPSLTNGQVSGTDTTLYFQCDSGFQLQGPSSLTCMPSGQWNGNFPYCEGTQPSPSDCADTTPDCRFYADGTFCQTDQVVIDNCPVTCGMCPGIFCAEISFLTNGQVLQSDGTTVSFTCDSGYQLQGPSSLTCTSSGQWSDNVPVCQPQTGPPQTAAPPEETLTSCEDNWDNCHEFQEYCGQQNSDGQTVQTNCPQTCGSCSGRKRRKRRFTENSKIVGL